LLLLDTIGTCEEKDGTSRLCSFHLERDDTSKLGKGFYLENTGHDGSSREMTIEKFFILGHTLDADGSLASLVLYDLVDKGKGV
jgi:hypothetical protein